MLVYCGCEECEFYNNEFCNADSISLDSVGECQTFVGRTLSDEEARNYLGFTDGEVKEC